MFLGLGLSLGAARSRGSSTPLPRSFDSDAATFDTNRMTWDRARIDTTPDAFSSQTQTDAPLSSTVVFDTFAISGTNATTTISVTGGEYKVEDGDWTSAAGYINPDQAVTVRHTSSASLETDTVTTLTIGGVSATFTSTTVLTDTTPDAFSFTAQTGKELSTAYDSNTVTITGINAPSPVLTSGGTVSINGGSQVTSGNVSNNQTIVARLTSSSSYSTLASMTVSVGGIEKTFSVTTKADPSPTPTPTPTPTETVAAPKGGTPDYVVPWKGTGSATMTELNRVLGLAYTAMAGSSSAPKDIRLDFGGEANQLTDFFPTARAYPSTVAIYSANPENPAYFARIALDPGMKNMLLQDIVCKYSPFSATSPVAVVFSETQFCTLSKARIIIPTQQARVLAQFAGTDNTWSRVGISGAGYGNNNWMVQVSHKNGTPCYNHRILDCAFQDGKGGDGLRIVGMQNGYVARTLIEDLYKFNWAPDGDHNDGVQVTSDDFLVPNSIEFVDCILIGNDEPHYFSGFQCTADINPAANKRNAALIYRRCITVGTDVNGIVVRNSTGGVIIEDCECYFYDIGIADADPPGIAIKNCYGAKVLGTNKAAGGLSFGYDPGWTTDTLAQNDGVYTGSDMTVDAAGKDAIIAAWKAGVGANCNFI